ncbi:MAG: hypothetical protein R3Y09_08550 [Clostridia bacterium]
MRKKKEQTTSSYVNMDNVPKIRARIIDGSGGLSFLPEVSAIRTRDVDCNLLIMEDFMPILGGIEGSVIFLTPKGEVRYDGIKGFYKHQQNEFTLIIQERLKKADDKTLNGTEEV